MFREMRRFKQQMPQDAVDEIMKNNDTGILAVTGDDGYPYTVPLSYVYCDGKIYFHSAKSGHKIDAIKNSSKVSFCVIDQDKIVPEEYTTYFRSVIVFGKARLIEDDGEKRRAVEILGRKYAPDATEERLNSAIESEWTPLCMIELSIDHMTGKEAIELVNEKA